MSIQPYASNPFYWSYNGEPVLLIGGSVEDNLFQIADLEAHLDTLAAVGGNYVRCTMSSRDEGDVWPFLPITTGSDGSTVYDLTQPNPVYWEKLERLLTLARERDIIAQIEVWDRFDFAREPWQSNPFNPRNNRQYSSEVSGLAEVITTHPGERENAFFRSVPERDNNMVVLPHQQRMVNWLLEITLKYPNVLYCMDNETNEHPAWGAYWAGYIRQKAEAAGVRMYLTEMWDAHDLTDPEHDATFDHPELYDFVDVSQNNHQVGYTHWANLQAVRERLKRGTGTRRTPCPMNMVKIYGANTGRYGTHRDAQERLWRAAFGGIASIRFHRPPTGLGLSPVAQTHIKALRMFTDALGIFTCEPRLDLLDWRSVNEAYCIAEPGRAYGIFFPDGGDVRLTLGADSPVTLRWLDIRQAVWLPTHAETTGQRSGDVLRVETPAPEGYWAALIEHTA